MKVLLNPGVNYNRVLKYSTCNPTFKSLDDALEGISGVKRLKELAHADTEVKGWKVAMKMADYGNPVRHAAWTAAGTKGAAIGSMLGPVGATVGFVVGAVAANYLCNKVRNKVIDNVGDWMDGD